MSVLTKPHIEQAVCLIEHQVRHPPEVSGLQLYQVNQTTLGEREREREREGGGEREREREREGGGERERERERGRPNINRQIFWIYSAWYTVNHDILELKNVRTKGTFQI